MNTARRLFRLCAPQTPTSIRESASTVTTASTRTPRRARGRGIATRVADCALSSRSRGADVHEVLPLQLVPQSGGDLVVEPGDVLFELTGAAHPDHATYDGWVGRGELERCRLQRHAPAFADRSD